MKRILSVLLVFVVLGTLATSVFAAGSVPGVSGKVSGKLRVVVEVPSAAIPAMDYMYKQFGTSWTNVVKKGNGREGKNGGREVVVGIAGLTVTTGTYQTITDSNGEFSFPPDVPGGNDVVIKSGQHIVYQGKAIAGQPIDVEKRLSIDDVAKTMKSISEGTPAEGGVKTSSHNGGHPHCNKSSSWGVFPFNGSDCAWNLWVNITWECWQEAMNTDSGGEDSENVWCSGEAHTSGWYAPCGYTGNHGFNCSYFQGHSEYWHED